MHSEWTPTRLGDLIGIKHGFAFKGKYFTDDVKRDVLLTPGNFAIGGGYQDRKLKYYDGPVPDDYVLNVGDLLITMTDLSKSGDTLGYPALVSADPHHRFLHNQRLGLVLIEDQSRLERRYLYYRLCAADYRHHVLATSSGSTVRHTSPSRIRDFEIILPPFEEQQAIAEILGSLDDKIELNRRMNRTLEQMAAAIFKAWFVDFEPVKAKADGAKSFLSMPQEVFDTLPAELTDSPLGPIPKGWDVGVLEDLLVLQRGFDLLKKQRTPGQYPVIAASGRNGTHTEFKVRGPGVTTGRSGVLGNVYLIQDDFWPLNTSLWVKEYRASNPYHAYFALQTLELALFNAGSAVPTLNRNHVHNCPMVVPPSPVADSFASMTETMFEQQHLNEGESDTLAAIRDALLPKLLSGEIRVGEAERIAEEVA